MADLLYCELLKLKRSKILLISILGAFVTPFMVLVGVIKEKINNPNTIITYADMFEKSSLYILMLFGLVVYTVIAAYLFSREYTENTLKTILIVPVSKISFILGKFLMLLLWILVLTLISWLSTLIFAVLSNAADFSLIVFVKYFTEYFTGALLLYLTLTPFVYIAIWNKGLVAPIITATAFAMFNVALFNESLAVFFPWSAVYYFASGQLDQFGYPIMASLLPILSVAIIGFIATVVHFNKEDIK